MSHPIVDSVYPENRVFGFTRVDGTLHFLTRVHALLQPNSTVLDVGCGRGHGIEDSCSYRKQFRRLAGEGRTIIGIDVDPDGATNPLVNEFRLIKDPRTWPVADASVDLVFSDYVLEHVADPHAFFSEANRVLRPGGFLCARTPNFLGYGAFISWLIPNRHHEKVLSRVQPGKKGIDVFPTVYRCNTGWKLRQLLRKHGFESVVYSIESEPGYLEFFPLGYRLAAAIHPYFPSMFKSTLLAFACKTIDAK
jgi:SAM-dependent methyltransferase